MKRFVLAALAAFATTPAFAGPLSLPKAGGFTVGLDVGADFSVSGDVHGGAAAPIADLGGLNPDLAGVASTLLIESRSFGDIYGETSISVGGEVGYGLSDSSQVFGAVRYVATGDGSAQVGLADVPALSAQLPVFGEFDEYAAVSLEAGYRQFFGDALARPYAGLRGGVAFVDSINATFTIPDAGITIENAPFYDSTATYTVGADVGVLVAATEFAAVSLETGVRYTGALDGDDSAIGGLGLAAINEEGGRLAIPVLVRGVLTF